MKRKDPAIRVIMMPKDLNHQGTVFGGVILSYIDQAGLVEAQKEAYHRYVTATISRVNFEAPIHCGDIVSFYAKEINTGNTSITIEVEVLAKYAEGKSKQIRVASAELVYVAIDRNGKPTSIHPPLDEPE